MVASADPDPSGEHEAAVQSDDRPVVDDGDDRTAEFGLFRSEQRVRIDSRRSLEGSDMTRTDPATEAGATGAMRAVM